MDSRRFAELAGICKTCDDKVCTLHPDCCFNYAANPIEVLRVMREREDWPMFVSKVGLRSGPDWVISDPTDYVLLSLILDTTGKLRDLAIEFMEGRK